MTKKMLFNRLMDTMIFTNNTINMVEGDKELKDLLDNLETIYALVAQTICDIYEDGIPENSYIPAYLTNRYFSTEPYKVNYKDNDDFFDFLNIIYKFKGDNDN